MSISPKSTDEQLHETQYIPKQNDIRMTHININARKQYHPEKKESDFYASIFTPVLSFAQFLGVTDLLVAIREKKFSKKSEIRYTYTDLIHSASIGTDHRFMEDWANIAVDVGYLTCNQTERLVETLVYTQIPYSSLRGSVENIGLRTFVLYDTAIRNYRPEYQNAICIFLDQPQFLYR